MTAEIYFVSLEATDEKTPEGLPAWITVGIDGERIRYVPAAKLEAAEKEIEELKERITAPRKTPE